MALRPCIGGAGKRIFLLRVQLPQELFGALRVVVQNPPQLYAGCCRHPPARAAAVAVRADLKPEARRFAAVLDRVLEREPDMVVERPAAEQPPRVAVNAGNVDIQVQIGIVLLKPVVELPCQRSGRRHDRVLKFLLVLCEPRPVIVEPDAPEHVDRLVGIACKHCFYSF